MLNVSTDTLQDTMAFLSECLKQGKPDEAVRLNYWHGDLRRSWRNSMSSSNSRSKVCVKYAGPIELWNDALVTTWQGESRRRLRHLRLSANTAMLRTACFLCVIGHRELLYEQFQQSECSFGYMAEQLGVTTWDLYDLLERRGLRTTNL